MPFYRPEWIQINTGDVELDFQLDSGRDQLSSDGWAYLVLRPDQIMGDVVNYTVPHIGGLRYVNDQGKGHGQVITKQGEGFNNEWHFSRDGASEKHLVVSAPRTQVPRLRYRTFFYNACDTGTHFIENFEHGKFAFTKHACVVKSATSLFVKYLIDGKTPEEAILLLDGPDNADEKPNQKTYDIVDF